MDVTNKNFIRLCLILLGVMAAVLIGFSSNALPINSGAEIVLRDTTSIHEVSDVLTSMLIKINSIVSYHYN